MNLSTLSICLLFAYGVGHAEEPIIQSTSSASSEELELRKLKADFPDSFDYDGKPLHILINATYGPLVENSDLHPRMETIRKTYPDTKLRPYIDYALAESTQALAEVVKKYPKDLFPKVTMTFLNAWNHYPSPGMRVAGLAQRQLAFTYFKYDYHNIRERNGGDTLNGEIEWKKVLDHYPDRFDSDNTITDNEWSTVVFYAYFALLEIYDTSGQLNKIFRLEDEMLTLPNHYFGDNTGANAHAEVYLHKTTRTASKMNYQKAIEYLHKIIVNYGNDSWGYHGGINIEYKHSSTGFLPAQHNIELLKKVIATDNVDESIKDWARLNLINALISASRESEAEQTLKEFFSEKPTYVMNALDCYDPKYTTVLWSPKEADVPIKDYYISLKVAYWKQKYPDEIDFDGKPLEMLFEANFLHNSDDVLHGYAKVKHTYPRSKVIPLIDYLLLDRQELNPTIPMLKKFIETHRGNLFPSMPICPFDFGCPIPGAEAAAWAQMKTAEITFRDKTKIIDASFHNQALKEWIKVLEYYPERTEAIGKIILPSVWESILFPAYFTAINLYVNLDSEDMALALVEEITSKTPNIAIHGYGFGSKLHESHPDAYLIKARILASKKAFAEMDMALLKSFESLANKTWIFLDQSEDGCFYYMIQTSYKYAPYQHTIELIDKILNIPALMNNVRPVGKAWAEIVKACLLYKSNDTESAKNRLKELFQANPEDVKSAIGLGYTSKDSPLYEFFGYDQNSPLKTYYQQLAYHAEGIK